MFNKCIFLLTVYSKQYRSIIVVCSVETSHGTPEMAMCSFCKTSWELIEEETYAFYWHISDEMKNACIELHGSEYLCMYITLMIRWRENVEGGME